MKKYYFKNYCNTQLDDVAWFDILHLKQWRSDIVSVT